MIAGVHRSSPTRPAAGRFFVGLPIPLGAGVVISMIIAHHGARGAQELPDFARVPIAGRRLV